MAALQGKTALVTGASRGIGRATASALAEAGARVLVHYGRSVKEAESLVAEIQRKADAQMRSRWTSELQMAQRCLPNRCAPSSATGWMCLCSTPESASQRHRRSHGRGFR